MALVMEAAIGTIDGVNATFDTSSPYVAGTLKHKLNGQLIAPDDPERGLTENGGTSFTLTEPPFVDDVIYVIYDDGTGVSVLSQVQINIRTQVLSVQLEDALRGVVFTFVQGDRLPRPTFYLTNSTGAALVLTDYTAKFQFHRVGDTVQVNAGDDDCVISDVLGGEITYVWSATDLATPGEYVGNLILVHTTLGEETMKDFLRFRVRRR